MRLTSSLFSGGSSKGKAGANFFERGGRSGSWLIATGGRGKCMGCFSREWYDIDRSFNSDRDERFRNVFFFKVSRNVRRRRIDLSPRGTEDRPNPLVFDHRSERRELAIEEQRMGNRWTKMLRTLIQKKISKESKRRGREKKRKWCKVKMKKNKKNRVRVILSGRQF